MNTLDKKYTDLLQDIMENGYLKSDRTGTGTISVFGRMFRHKMSEGFPLLTTKKMAFKNIVTELIWFLKGETNIQSLVRAGNYIWVGDAYKKFRNEAEKIKEAYENGDLLGSQPHIESMFSAPEELIILNKKEFIESIKTNDEFAKEWGELGPIYGKQWRGWNTKIPISMKDKIEYVLSGKTKSPIEMENLAITEAALDPNETPQFVEIDQIQNLINDLRKNPDSRRMMVNSWNVGEIENMTLPPCHFGFQVYTRKLNTDERCELLNRLHNLDCKKTELHTDELFESEVKTDSDKLGVPSREISLLFNMRSVDVPLGLPFNIASYGILLLILSKMVNMIPGELIGSLGDTHIYNNQIEGIEKQLTRISMNLPNLIISEGVNFGGNIDDLLASCDEYSFKLDGYESHPSIKIPLSN